jgi:D-alanyl-D-alanine carboxypeptidase
VAAVALVTAACSSSDDTSEPSAAPPVASAAPSATPATVGAEASTEPPYAAPLRSTLEAVVHETLVPSAVVMVSSPTFGDATFSFGSLVRGGQQRPTAVDHYRIGSDTKPMTATIALQLVQEGKLALDDPISKYRPDVPNGDAITIAQLLDMRSGLANYTEDPAFLRAIDADRKRVWRPDELLALAFSKPPLFAPGTSWHYSNTNYILLGLVMEQLTGKSAEELFGERLFAPLGLVDTVMPAPADASIPEPYARGYQYGDAETSGGPDPALSPADQRAAADGTLLPDDWSGINPSWGWTAGSVISTANDLAAFVQALVDGGLLTPEMQQTRLQSIQPTDPANPTGLGYGLGLMRISTYYGHNGQIPGFNSFMLRDPDTETSIIVLTSLTSAPDGRAPADELALAVITELASAAGTASVPTTSDAGQEPTTGP